jgi:glycosyltransferase involved in cell wall biosynthesis
LVEASVTPGRSASVVSAEEGTAQSPLPTVSVVVPTHGRRSHLAQLVPSILADPATTELIVVVDGSEDGSIELLRELAEDDARLKPTVVPRGGPAAARSEGTCAAGGDVLLFFDDDQLPEPGCVEGHARHHATAPDLVVSGYSPTVLPVRRRPGDFATYLYAEEYERSCGLVERDPDAVLRNLWGGNLSIRRSEGLRIGLASDFSVLYHEDQDFGLRCLKGGMRGRFDRSLVVRHLHRRPLDAFVVGARRQGAGRRRIHELHGGTGAAFSPRAFEEGLPLAGRALVRLTRAPAVYRAVTPLLIGSVRLMGRLRLFPLETAAAKLLRRVENQQGARMGDLLEPL